mgnify:FL=1
MNEKVHALINQQINTEFYSAYLYLNFSNYFEEVGLDGFANWYKIQAQEERDHAMLFYQYLQNENQKVTFEAIDKPDLNAACHMDVLKAGLEHEKYVTSLINDIYSEAYEAKDFRTMQFLDWFVKEQGEEETNAKNLISKIELFGSDPKSLYMLNQELAARVYGNGLRLVLQNLSKHILVFETPEAARKKLGKKKPMLWVVTEALTKQPDQPCMCNGLQGIKPFQALIRFVDLSVKIVRHDDRVISQPYRNQAQENNDCRYCEYNAGLPISPRHRCFSSRRESVYPVKQQICKRKCGNT